MDLTRKENMNISELIQHLQQIKEEHGDLSVARHVEYDESDPEDAYSYSFSQPVVIHVVEQNYGDGYTELHDVTGEEDTYDSKKVVILT